MWTARLLKALPACSTPYGNQRKITFLPSLAYTWDNLFVLNALRQSEENHALLLLGGQGGDYVLNALRQSEENHSDPAHFRKSEHLVLNALRQSEENHLGGLGGNRWVS